MNRAYSILTVKAVQDDQRIITGIATTPSVDRVGDVVDPMGVKFTNPLSLLHQHDSDRPVGVAKFGKPTKDGIPFEATLPTITEPGPLKDRVDTAWGEVKNGLVRAVSIGFRPIEYSFIENGGIHFSEIEVYELSLVSVPAQADAVISTIKSIDAPLLAATGKTQKPSDRPVPPGDTGKPKRPVKLNAPKEGKEMKTIAEQISALETKRAAHVARQEVIMQKGMEEGRSTDEAEQEEFDTLDAELKSIDGDLTRLRSLEATKAKSARPVIKADDESGGSNARGVRVEVKSAPKLEPGIRFARVAKCIALAKGSSGDAIRVAEHYYGDDEAVIGVLKAAVVGGSNVSGNWAANLTGADTSVYADFVEFLRPKTILGKFGQGGIPSLREVPFRVPLIGQTGGGAGYWVGEGKGKPLTAFDFSRTTLEPLKVANIAVLTMESVRDSSPKSDVIVRDQLAAALQARLDTDFIDPSKTASAGVSPASITNGATAIASTGTDADAVRLDLRALFNQFDLADNDNDDAVLIMSTKNARALAQMVNPLGQPEFDKITRNGGFLAEVPVIVSRYASTNVVMLSASDIYLGDEGGVSVDMSSEASLEMSDAPAQSALTGTGASLVSMFQTNSIAIRAERTINWKRRRATSVSYLTGAAWGGAVPLS